MIDQLPIAIPAVLALLMFLMVAIGLAWRDRDEDEDFRQTAGRTREKASTLTGGTLGVIGVVLFGIVGALQTLGTTSVEVGLFGLDVIGANPELSGGVVAALLGWLGIRGSLDISGMTYLGIAMVILGLGFLLAAKRRIDRRAAFD